MLPRHRRRIYLGTTDYQSRASVIPRVLMGGVVVIVLWYVISIVLSFFDGSIGTRSSVVLDTSSESVEVALQGEDWQRASNGIRLYPDDAISSKSASDAVLRYFDGSRARLDANTEMHIVESDERTEASSSIIQELRSGRLWIRTPDATSYTGSIIRTVETEYASVSIPSGASALVSPELIHVLSADGQGLSVTLLTGSAEGKTVIVGEGQFLSLSAEKRSLLDSGVDPYTLRDPATTELLRDPFVSSSLAMLAKATTVQAPNEGADSTDTDDLVISSPEEGSSINGKTVSVTGTTTDRVALLLIQGQEVGIDSDGSFDVELSVPEGESLLIRIEAQDAQGVPLGLIERSVKSTWKAFVEPVRITAPVGSGGTFVTALREIELAGEAPAGTAQIRVNDYNLQLFQAGARTWSYLASEALGNLKPGANTFNVYAVDASGNVSAGRSIVIQLNATETPVEAPPLKQNTPIEPGSLRVTGPAAGTQATVTQNDVLLEGLTSPLTASISINGYTLSLYTAGKTTWNYIANTEFGTLKRGRNTYRIVSRNASGEILDVLEYVMTYEP
ncbi:MAG: hypothetical protein ABL890_02185 [Candidatus Peribacteraceae bacterium]